MQTEAEAFLQRIRAYPDDDAQRLIFADWLDEEGDPRGRFIRVQLALAHMPESDPARKQLLIDEQELLAAHRKQWEAPFHGLASGMEFRRGFVDEVKVAARQFVRHAPEIFTAAPVQHVHLLDVGGSLPAVVQCPFLSRLTALTIHAQHTGDPLARALARCEHLGGLKRLYLTRNRLADDAAEQLAASPTLANLEELDLSENEVGETGGRALAASPHLGKLRRLELRDNRLGPAGAEALAGSERLAALFHLGLSGNDVGGPRLNSLSRANDLLRVPALDLSANGLTTPGLQAIFLRRADGETGAPRLTDLDLGYNALGDEGAMVLAQSPHLEGLTALRLAQCGINNGGLGYLANSPHLNRLALLDLSNNPAGDSGFRALLNAPHLRSLRRLILSRIGIALGLQRDLDLKYNRPPRR
jgi:uncharacterized protein (TIGR02996 family)